MEMSSAYLRVKGRPRRMPAPGQALSFWLPAIIIMASGSLKAELRTPYCHAFRRLSFRL